MSSLNLPARDVLRLAGATTIAWAVFDAEWYRSTWPGDTAHLVAAPDDMVLEFYFDAGQKLGHSPNMLFDEAWHRHTWPGIAALVDGGQFPSAFDAWCRGGNRERSPHWLFDELEYHRRNPHLTDAFLNRHGLANGYDHYLWRGNAEGRIGHPLFDPAVYCAGLDPEAADEAAVDGPFWHCLRRLHRREAEVRASACFDPDWYLGRYPAVAGAIAAGEWRWALEHYLCNATPTLFDPVPAFSESDYLSRYPDAAEMVRRGEIRNGFAHFLRHGLAERRSPGDPVQFGEHHAGGQDAADRFVHWLAVSQTAGMGENQSHLGRGDQTHGRPGLPRAPLDALDSRALFHRHAELLSVLHARTKLNFATGGTPMLSVVMVLRDRFALTMMTLGSLRANYSGEIDLILIDTGSTDETRAIERYVRGATCFRFDADMGLLTARNAALQFAAGDAVLYLSNATELAPGAIAAALRRLQAEPRAGSVGGMIVSGDGLLWEAGGAVEDDGTIQPRMRGISPLVPEANFTREVAFCSTIFLLARRTLLNELEGFDESLASAGVADADLCLRMKAAGFPVLYDPAVVVRYFQQDDEVEIERANQAFARKHTDYLAGRPRREAGSRPSADSSRMRVLFVEDTVPLRRMGSGYVRSNDIVGEMAALGYAVTVYPLNGCDFDVSSVYADMPDDVEVMHDHSADQFHAFLHRRLGDFEAIWIARTHNLATVRAGLEHVAPKTSALHPWPLIVLDTEALAAVRSSGQAALEGRPFDFAAALGAELRDAAFCQKIVAINATEAAILRDLAFPDVTVLGHMRIPRPTPRPFTQRTGMLFVGAIHRMDSPNYDSLCWFIDEVLPLIARELTWETRLTVAGYIGMGVSLDRFRDHPRVTLRGTVSDLEPLYDSHRVFVAPTRIAAGTPYKVHEAASFGLPVVATALLRRQLGWEDGRDLLAADASDPGAFARHVVAVQREEPLWQRLRVAALDRLRRENNREDYAAAIRGVLGSPMEAARGNQPGNRS